MEASIMVHGLDAIRRGLAHSPELTRAELWKAMDEAVLLLQSDIQGNFPKHTGTTRASIGGEAFMTDAGVLGVVGSAQPLVSWIEFGTRPHGISEEGRAAVAAWAMSKLGLGEKEALGLAEGYARKVRMLGTKPNPVMQDSLERNLPVIARMFDDAAGRIAEQLLGTGGAA